MKHPLVWIAVGGFALSATFLVSAAVMSDGLEDGWDWRGHFERESDDTGRDHSIIERELTWDAEDEISINAPASVTYSYAATPRVTVRGPAFAVKRLEMHGGDIEMSRRTRNSGKIEITLAGPAIRKFSVKGAAQLKLNNLKQDELEVSVAGASEITADGEVRKLEVSIAGASEVNFTDLKVDDAKVSISGFGDVRIAPHESADVSIAGAGEVKLMTRPKRLSTHIAGAGNVSQPDEDELPSVGPMPPAMPKMPATPRMPAMQKMPPNPAKLPQQ
jgi:Putative auto-transporter adhesin, head GIN domain